MPRIPNDGVGGEEALYVDRFPLMMHKLALLAKDSLTMDMARKAPSRAWKKCLSSVGGRK